VAAVSAAIALTGAGSAYACDGSRGSSDTPGTYPGVDREHVDHHVVLDDGGDHVPQGTPGGPPARSRGAVLSD